MDLVWLNTDGWLFLYTILQFQNFLEASEYVFFTGQDSLTKVADTIQTRSACSLNWYLCNIF